jgi:predicted secreted protein
MIVHSAVLVSAFAIFWFVAFLCLLPVGIGAVDAATGAPKRPYLARKAAIATAIAVVLFAAFFALIAFGMLDL